MIENDKLPKLNQEKFKVLFIDGESLFNFVYNAFIQANWSKDKEYNSLNPLLNYLFKIIYRSPDLDNYTYSYDNFFEDTRGFVIDDTITKQEMDYYSEYFEKEQSNETTNKYFYGIFPKFKKYKANLSHMLANYKIDWKTLFFSILNYLKLFTSNIYSTYSKVFIAFDWVNPNNQMGFYDANIPFNQNFRNIVLNRIYKNQDFLYIKNFTEKLQLEEGFGFAKDRIFYNDSISSLRIDKKSKNKNNDWYEIARKHFIDCLIELKFNILTIPLLESYDVIYTYLKMLKSDKDWERRLSFLDLDNFNQQGSYFYINSLNKIPIEYYIFSQNDIFRSMISNDVTRIKIKKKSQKNVEYFEFETFHWFFNKYKFMPSVYNDYSFLTFEPFLNNNNNKKIIQGFGEQEAIKFLEKYHSIENFEKFAYKFWENHEITYKEDNTKMCYKKFGDYYIRCLYKERNNKEEHKNLFNLTRSEMEYFIKVYKLIYCIKDNKELKSILSYDETSKKNNKLITNYYKLIYNRSDININKFIYKEYTYNLLHLNKYDSNFPIILDGEFNINSIKDIYKYKYSSDKKTNMWREYDENKNTLFNPVYAPISNLKRLFSPLNINSSIFNLFFYEISNSNREYAEKIIDLIAWYSTKNKYLKILINNLEFIKGKVQKTLTNKQNKNSILIDNNFLTGIDTNMLNPSVLKHFENNDSESDFIKKIKLHIDNNKQLLLESLLNENIAGDNPFKREQVISNMNWLKQYITFDFLFSDINLIEEIFNKKSKYRYKNSAFNKKIILTNALDKITTFSTQIMKKIVKNKE